MTAADWRQASDNSPDVRFAVNEPVRRVGLTCRTAVDGRRASRALNEWARRFSLGEPEFQVLWCLSGYSAEGLDQTTLAKALVCSAAQVSAIVERLKARGWIQQRPEAQDRRRHLWQLSPAGQSLLSEMLTAAGYLNYAVDERERLDHACDERPEAA